MKLSWRKVAASVLATSVLIGSVGMASADQVSNNLDASVDSAHESMALTAGGATGSTVMRIIEVNGDGKNGCNLTGSTTLVVSVGSSDTDVATVSPSSLTFDSCGATHTVTVTPLAAGSATISLTQTSNTTTGTFDLAPARFDVDVAAAGDPCAGRNSPAAPSISEPNAASKSTSGWYNAGSAPASFEVTPATDAEYSLDNGDNWTAYSAAVTLGEGEHDVIARNFLPATTDPACARVDGAATVPTEIDVDTTAPSATPASVVDTTWRNSSLSETFTFSDGGSGLEPEQGLTADDEATVTASDESTDASTPTVESVTISDIAGNTVTRSVSALIDLTKPTVELSGGPANGTSYYFGSVPAAPDCTASDALSGLADADSASGQQDCVVSGYGSGVGTHTVIAVATDNAGNTDQDSRTYTVLAWNRTGFHSPVTYDPNRINTVKGGSTVPLKFNLYAGPVGTDEVTQVSVLGAVFEKTVKTPCDSSDAETTTEVANTGGTDLRYADTQFVKNWKVPTAKGCYMVTLTFADGRSAPITADFKVK